MLHAGFNIIALFVAHDDDRATTETTQTTNNGLVLTKIPVTGKRREIFDQRLRVIEEMGPIRMSGDLRLLPGIEIGVHVF